MGKDKPPQSNQSQTKMDQFTKPGPGSRGTGAPGLSEEPTNAPTGTEAILNAIKDSCDAVEWKIDEERIDVSLLRQDLRKVADRVTEAETRVSTAEDDIAILKSQVTQLLHTTVILEYRAEDAENHLRRNNLRLVGVPEGVDTMDMTLLMEEWFLSWITPGTLSKNFAV